MSSSPVSYSSHSIFSRASTHTSSVATSPSPDSVKMEREQSQEDGTPDFDNMDEHERYQRLEGLLKKSSAYARLLKDRMDMNKVKAMAVAVESPGRPRVGQKRRRGGATFRQKRGKVVDSEDEESSPETEKRSEKGKFQQSELVTGAILRDYQLDGVEWMAGLYENGMSGILADEMGLGKTLQTIAFHAHIRQKVSSLFLVVCPLSVLHNWVEEFNKFAPSIPVCMYHGTPTERAELRRTVMRPVREDDKEKDAEPVQKKPKPTLPRRSAQRKCKQAPQQESEDKSEGEDDAPGKEDFSTQPIATFPVVITTYEMIIKDRQYLANYQWGYIVVDEGHRLKNYDCKLVQEIKKYPSAGRMILTGTPLQNNLAELWSLLNFIMPDIFFDIYTFQEWFNLPTMHSTLSSSQSSHVIHTLHSILKPFLLRRLKADVEQDLPPKKEYVLYAPLTERQRSVYSAVLDGGLRRFLINGKHRAEEDEIDRCKQEKARERMMTEGRRLRRRRGHAQYDLDGDDDEYFDRLEAGELDRTGQEDRRREMMDLGREYHRKTAMKQVNNLRLQNTVMQLRKVCSHPFLFDWPTDPHTRDPVVNSELVDASGKMMVLDRLLSELFKRDHKVLLFSQFTTMLDIIEAWAEESKGWRLCRIDGSTPPAERREQMNAFQQGGTARDAPRLFLLSTRAGGLGITLTAADTVIFYDQDWNPQMDVQAQDRAHRIGQTRPVLIFRLLSAHTIETKIMQRATAKRQLEALVIAKGRFKLPGALAAGGGKESMADLAAALLKLEGEKIDVVPNTAAGKAGVISDEDLDALLDRSPEVFSDRGRGWTSADKGTAHGTAEKPKAAFEVFEGRADETNDALARMMGEDVE